MKPIERVVQAVERVVQASNARIAELEAEQAEERRKIELLTVAELAASRKDGIYFFIARTLIEGVGAEQILPWLRTPEGLRRTADAMEIAEKDVDRAGLKVVKSFLAAHRAMQAGPPKLSLREAYQKVKLEDVEKEYRKLYPRQRVPELRSIGRTLNRKATLARQVRQTTEKPRQIRVKVGVIIPPVLSQPYGCRARKKA